MKNKIYLTMGSLVEKRNDFDTDEVKRTIPLLQDEGFIDGCEFMFIRFYYEGDAGRKLARDLVREGCVFPTFHTHKDIGARLSDGGVALSEGDGVTAEKLRREALDMFRYNCETAVEAGSKRLVLHLWGGLNSDRAIGFNAAALPSLLGTADEYSLRLMIENVPSTVTDPLTNLLKIKELFGRCGIVFDTRFATCHRNAKETLSDPDVAPHIEHVHISDYRGGHKDFSCLRPIYHPGEGKCDYALIFGMLKDMGYESSFTLESPGIAGEGPQIDLDRLKRSLAFIRTGVSE